MHLYDRPKVIVYRFIGVLITSGRLKFDYVNITSEHLANFLAENWDSEELRAAITQLREMSLVDREQIEDKDAAVPMPCIVFKLTQNPRAIHDSACMYFNWRMKRNGPLKPCLGRTRAAVDRRLIGWVVADALVNGRATITLHERYAVALKKRQTDGIRQYMLSMANAEDVDYERRLLAFTSQGDLSQYFDGFLNADAFNPESESTYQNIAHLLSVQPGELLFVSASLDECKAAASAGCMVAKVKHGGGHGSKKEDAKDGGLSAENSNVHRVRDMSDIVWKAARLLSMQQPQPQQPVHPQQQSKHSSSSWSSQSSSMPVKGGEGVCITKDSNAKVQKAKSNSKFSKQKQTKDKQQVQQLLLELAAKKSIRSPLGLSSDLSSSHSSSPPSKPKGSNQQKQKQKQQANTNNNSLRMSLLDGSDGSPSDTSIISVQSKEAAAALPKPSPSSSKSSSSPPIPREPTKVAKVSNKKDGRPRGGSSKSTISKTTTNKKEGLEGKKSGK